MISILVRHSKDYYRLLDSVVDNELATKEIANNKTLWVAMGNELEIQGIEKTRISTIIRKDIEDVLYEKKFKEYMPREDYKWHNGNFWLVTKSNGWSDPTMARHVTDPNSDQDNSSLSTIETENYEYINLINKTITFLKDIALPKLRENKFMSLLDDADNKVSLALHDWNAQLKLAESFFNHKEKIPVNTQHFLLQAIGTYSSNNEAATEYFRLQEKAHKLTGKQISKYRSGQIKTKLEIFNPHGRLTAILWDYFGVQCNECKSWRVLKANTLNNVKCMDCNNIFEAKDVYRCNYCRYPYFDEEIIHIKKHKSCPRCNQDLPEYLIDNITN